ncbi:MAG TPA: hypothetical protein PKK26_10325, partial [Candidatus Wallbacteria bacterium]|nr:hypothetical protein [Candidatus Wallbacteria bacterium]
INYYIFIFIFDLACSDYMPAVSGFILSAAFLLLLKVMTFLLIAAAAVLLSKALEKVEKWPLLYNSFSIFLSLAAGLVAFIIVIVPFLENYKLNSIFNGFYVNLPTSFLIKALLAFSRGDFLTGFGDLAIIIVFTAILYCIFRKYNSQSLYGEGVLFNAEDYSKSLVIKSSNKIHSYNENSIYPALIKKDLNYLSTAIIFGIMHAGYCYLIISMNSAASSRAYILSNCLGLASLMPFMLYSIDVRGLSFLKSMPISLKTVYRAKILSCIFFDIFLMLITYSIFYIFIYNEFKVFLFSRNFYLFTFSVVWLNIYMSDLFLFFAFRKKSRTAFSKLAFF